MKSSSAFKTPFITFGAPEKGAPVGTHYET